MTRELLVPCPLCGQWLNSLEAQGIHVSAHNTAEGRKRNWGAFLRRKRRKMWESVRKTTR